jgi:hypothetical protein
MVTVVQKSIGQTWSREEVSKLVQACGECEQHGNFPHRLVVKNKPIDGRTFQDVLGHSSFSTYGLPYYERWRQ